MRVRKLLCAQKMDSNFDELYPLKDFKSKLFSTPPYPSLKMISCFPMGRPRDQLNKFAACIFVLCCGSRHFRLLLAIVASLQGFSHFFK